MASAVGGKKTAASLAGIAAKFLPLAVLYRLYRGMQRLVEETGDANVNEEAQLSRWASGETKAPSREGAREGITRLVGRIRAKLTKGIA